MKFLIGFVVFFYTQISYGQKKDSVLYKSNISWSDFKANPPINSINGNLSCTIQMKTEKVNVWTGVTTFKTWSVFYPAESWVAESSKNDDLLAYFQGIMNICEVYARRLSKEVNSKKINGANKTKMTKIFQEYDKMNIEEQKKFEQETNFGKNTVQLESWTKKLKSELEQ